jgi:LysM repeat protein
MFWRASRLVAVITSAVLAASALTAIVSDVAPASAVSGSSFDPGLIISDSVFYDFGTMSVDDIQRFLDSKVTKCLAKSAPTCLRYYVTDVPAQPADPGRCAAVPAAAAQTAAQVIFTAANACGINPRVLLVMLEKEQGLISSQRPSLYMYKAALGYGCPDSNPAICGNVYTGLFNQVFHAAGQLRWYGNPKGSYTYLKPGKTISRPYSPKSYAVLDKNGNVVTPAKCGFKTFVLQNQATANLYYYTPFAPNDAALKNLYSMGDSCSAYGNRNFWRFYWDWFGSPIGGGFLLKSDSSDIYLIVNDTRYRVSDPSIATALAPLGPVGTISQAYLESFKLGPDLTRVFSSATGQYYFFDDSKRFTFSDCNQVKALGLDCAKAVQLTNSQISALAPAGAVTAYVAGASGDSYLIQNGVRHEILDDESVSAAQIKLPTLSPVAASAFSYLPWGAPIAKDASLFINRDNSNVGVTAGGAYFELDPSVSANVDFTKWFRESTGSLSTDGVSTVTSGELVTDYIAGPNHDTYLITAQGKRPITNPAAFIDPLSASVVSQALLDLLPTDNQPLTAPVLVRAASNKATYLVRGGLRRLVENPAAAALVGSGLPSPAPVVIADSALAAIKVGQTQLAPGSLVAIKGKPSLYLIDGLDSRIKVASPAIAGQFGLGRVRVLASSAVAAFAPTTTLAGIKVSCGDKTLVAVDGALHTLNSGWSLEYPGASLSLDATTCLALHRSSAPIGRFILTPDAKYWVVMGGQKRLLTGKPRYQKLRGDGPAVIKVSSAFASFLKTGTPIKKSASVPLDFPVPNQTPSPSASPTPSPSASPTTSPTAAPTPKPSPTPKPTTLPSVKKYTVLPGDTMSKIAKKFLPAGASSAAVAAEIAVIVKANKLANVNVIQVGQVLTIP